MRRWSIGALSPTSHKEVSKVLQTPPTCLRIPESFRNKCLKSSDQLLKMVRKSSRKRDLLVIQGLNQYCLRILLINRLYTIMATIVAFWFTLCRCSNCNCPVVNILKTCKEMIRLWKVSLLCALFWLRFDRQLVSDQSPLSCNQSPIFTD